MTGQVVLRWVRSGLGAAVTQAPGPAASARPPLPLTLRVQHDGATVATVAPEGLSLLGPGDVTSFDHRQVVGCWPQAETTGVSAADLVHVEFADPALPWLVTPFCPDSAGNLAPWLALVVVPDELVTLPAGSAVARIEAPADTLPPWEQLASWAHVTLADPAIEAADRSAIAAAVRTPGGARSRLVCPLRLAEGTVYRACLVPTFKAGADALDNALTITSITEPAWTAGAAASLPVYWSYRFSTGTARTFEDLALALRPQGEDEPGDIVVGGGRTLDVGQAGPGLPDGPPLQLGGALRVPGPTTTVPYDATALRAARAENADLPAPTWGDWHATLEIPSWLDDLNDSPPYRVAAGLGAQTVRTYQEELVAAAWEQAGQVAEANEQLRHAQAALAVAQLMWSRRVAVLEAVPAALLQLAGPARSRLPIDAAMPRSLDGRIRQTCLPPEVLHAAFRRLSRPSGALGRRIAATRDGAFFRGLLLSRFTGGQPDPAPNAAPESIHTPEGAGTVPAPPEPHIAAAVAAWLASVPAGPPQCTPPDLPALAAATVAALDPSAVLPHRVGSRIDVRGTPAAPERPGTALSPLRIGPRIDVPMVDLLREQGLDWLLPGIGSLTDNRILLADPDPAFIEAFLVGANHEMSRELAWRRYPADPSASVLTSFWDRGAQAEMVPDVPDLATWTGALGSHLDPGARLGVLVARGELFRQHPDVRVYVHRAVSTPQGIRPAPVADDAAWIAETRLPVIQAQVPPGVRLFGFPKSAAELRGQRADPGWFVVLAERPVGNRFGLSATRANTLGVWSDLSWADVRLTSGHLDATTAPSRAPATGPAWSSRSDVLPGVLRRPPFRLFVHARRLLPED
ncbi:hypothetical protein [Streptomyces sp. NPDC005046]